jgi:hypothetical protein
VRFRCYTTDDIVGVEFGGALKNVLAIACGISDGLGFGYNARAALMTRGSTLLNHCGRLYSILLKLPMSAGLDELSRLAGMRFFDYVLLLWATYLRAILFHCSEMWCKSSYFGGALWSWRSYSDVYRRFEQVRWFTLPHYNHMIDT